MTARIIELLTHLHGPLAFVRHSAETATNPLGGMVDAVQNRAAPEAALLSAYVASRLAKPKLAEVLAEVCAARIPGRLPATQIRRASRRLHTIGPLGASDWNWLFDLALLAGRRDLSVEELARRHGVEARTFRTHVRKYTGGTVERFRECLGWEWVLEAALRTWDCLRAPLGPGESAARSA
jgi:hypothetical protein